MSRLILASLLFSGCKVVDAPESIEELVVFGFVNFDVDAAHRAAFADGATEQLDRHQKKLTEGVRVDALTANVIADLGLRKKSEAKAVKGVANHTWTGLKLLAAETRIASRIIGRMLQGRSISRRERSLLQVASVA